jgi:hypothetical protein
MVSLCQEKSTRFLGALRSARISSDPVIRLLFFFPNPPVQMAEVADSVLPAEFDNVPQGTQ